MLTLGGLIKLLYGGNKKRRENKEGGAVGACQTHTAKRTSEVRIWNMRLLADLSAIARPLSEFKIYHHKIRSNFP